MIEYIPRKAVENFIEKGLNNPDKSKAYGFDAVEILSEVRFMPVADVATVVHGNWIIEEDERRCPICHFFYSTNGLISYDYCPGCGAKMDGGRQNENNKTRQQI